MFESGFVGYLFKFFFVLNPHIVVPFFFSCTQNYTQSERRTLAVRMTLFGLGLGILFAAFGTHVLGLVGVDIPAFRIGGGILLMVAAWNMLYGDSSNGAASNEEPTQTHHMDISLCPLAFPMLVGPATLTTLVGMVNEAKSVSFIEPFLVTLAMVTIIGINYALILFGAPLFKLLGKSGGLILEKVSGILLVSMAIQMICGGIKSFFGW